MYSPPTWRPGATRRKRPSTRTWPGRPSTSGCGGSSASSAPISGRPSRGRRSTWRCSRWRRVRPGSAFARSGAWAEQGNEPGVGGGEAAAAEVERAEMVLEVDVQPLAARGLGFFGRDGDQPGADPVVLGAFGDQGVEDEGVDAAVPGDVDEADEAFAVPRADPAQAVLADLRYPVVVQDLVVEPLGVQGVQLGVGEGAAP